MRQRDRARLPMTQDKSFARVSTFLVPRGTRIRNKLWEELGYFVTTRNAPFSGLQFGRCPYIYSLQHERIRLLVGEVAFFCKAPLLSETITFPRCDDSSLGRSPGEKNRACDHKFCNRLPRQLNNLAVLTGGKVTTF